MATDSGSVAVFQWTVKIWHQSCVLNVHMMTQYTIFLGAHSNHDRAKAIWKAGKFDADDFQTMRKILRLRGLPGSTILAAQFFFCKMFEHLN